MKKILLILAIVGLSFTSCTSDDSQEPTYEKQTERIQLLDKSDNVEKITESDVPKELMVDMFLFRKDFDGVDIYVITDSKNNITYYKKNESWYMINNSIKMIIDAGEYHE